MNSSTLSSSPVNSFLYRTLWRWHFYAGIFCIPFILALSISGAIYLFKPQIDAWVESPYQQLAVTNNRHTPQQQIQAALAAVGQQSTFVNYRLPESEQHAVVVSVAEQGQRFMVYVNPYTLEVLKIQKRDALFIQFVRSFHGELLLGTFGSILVELAGCWAIVLIISGLYLWWPRSARGFGGVLFPRLNKRGRLFWRDLHAVTGVWVSLFALFLLITGLPWALVWGSAFKEIRSFTTPMLQQDWAISEHHAEHHSGATLSFTQLTASMIKNAQALAFAPPVEISVARNKPNQFQVASQHQNRPLRSTAWFDGITGKQTSIEHFADRNGIDRAIGFGIAAHEGQLFGWLNQLLGLFTTLGLIAVAITGFVLWRKRKPSGELGAPLAKSQRGLTPAVAIVGVALVILLPLLAISVLFILVIDFLVLPRIPATREWLGLDRP
ncbi:PepSY-associated TM helix domain-containing protein [Teredinibacter waterburyi]|jgi:Uncharacterized iron-regulated membrane protein|uniref:PepSY-associated TM helix domain-containing protein n=1 Tax=Teredinibacter waterburyi TaxID=1500538 RepID=UPI00165F24F7|nr:PepSY domain-containing protein [Teredinibacter waterburyi]